MENKVIDLRDFPGQTALELFREAMKYCREHPHTTLRIPPGEHILRDPAAVRLMDEVMSGKMGNNPQDRIFRPYFPYARGLDLSGCRDLIIEGYGARLICAGWMEPLSIDQCQNITVKGLTIDYLRKPYSVGTVVDAGAGYYDVEFPARYPVNAAMPSPRIYRYSIAKARFEGDGWDCDRKEVVAGQIIRFYNDQPELPAGTTICVWHGFHFRPAILINESANTALLDVTIHSQPGMGIVGHRSENIRLERLRIVPEAGEYLSVNTDATHFTSCKGDLLLEGCQFEGQGDDSLNVHNYYYTILGRRGNTCEIAVTDADAHAQVLDYPDPSDILELVDAETLSAVRTYRVVSVENHPDQWQSTLVLDADLPEATDAANFYLINTTRLPKLRFLNCHVRNHRSRGVLIKTRQALVEGCTFDGCTGMAVHIAAEGGWHEGPASAQVTIRNNRMLRCGWAMRGSVLDVCGVCVNIEAPVADTPGLHKDITIENNIIVGEQSACGIYVACSANVNIRFNEISGCSQPVMVLHSSNVTVLENPIRQVP